MSRERFRDNAQYFPADWHSENERPFGRNVGSDETHIRYFDYLLAKEEAEAEHRADDDVLEAIYKMIEQDDLQSSKIKIMIEKRWADQGGRYWNGVYNTFKS